MQYKNIGTFAPPGKFSVGIVKCDPFVLHCVLKALSHAEQERSLLQEKLSSAERELSSDVAEHGRQKRETQSRHEQQSQHIDALQLELSSIQQHLQHTK